MRFKLFLLMIFLGLPLAGCKLTEVKGEVGGVEVEAKDKDQHDEGEFCPPGQAKKGRC